MREADSYQTWQVEQSGWAEAAGPTEGRSWFWQQAMPSVTYFSFNHIKAISQQACREPAGWDFSVPEATGLQSTHHTECAPLPSLGIILLLPRTLQLNQEILKLLSNLLPWHIPAARGQETNTVQLFSTNMQNLYVLMRLVAATVPMSARPVPLSMQSVG